MYDLVLDFEIQPNKQFPVFTWHRQEYGIFIREANPLKSILNELIN
jgi:hypothetical protein